ncbi:MAG: AAA family ATPase [Methanomassiliicoccaceae archaeon]|jgi:adenosylcobyric acid synthase|nr:AAA family ATPase [Methanomassiliicoccaceae archaeon]
MRVMFVGTSSSAGKTLISALFCRYLRSKMVMVTPFKALNLSSRSFVTDDGAEIGIGQALQAWASDLKPNGRMNPILIKPSGGKLRTIANGADGDKMDRKAKFAHALKVYDELCDKFDAVVVEGSGSPAEINLRENDIANINFAVARDIPMILIGDIEKGGVFAGIYGTWRLIGDEGRRLMKGFIINKYYGDKDILKSGIDRIESLTGMRCMGVLPHISVSLPEEDDSPCGIRHEHRDDKIGSYVEALDMMLEDIAEHIDMEGIIKLTE